MEKSITQSDYKVWKSVKMTENIEYRPEYVPVLDCLFRLEICRDIGITDFITNLCP